MALCLVRGRCPRPTSLRDGPAGEMTMSTLRTTPPAATPRQFETKLVVSYSPLGGHVSAIRSPRPPRGLRMLVPAHARKKADKTGHARTRPAAPHRTVNPAYAGTLPRTYAASIRACTSSIREYDIR